MKNVRLIIEIAGLIFALFCFIAFWYYFLIGVIPWVYPVIGTFVASHGAFIGGLIHLILKFKRKKKIKNKIKSDNK